MSIIQISKIQQRSGNLVDLPQLDQAEFGWASDASRLFIGKTAEGGNIENVEVLTAYSNISFSQLDGAVGNLNIDPTTAENGQVLTYDGTNWINRGGTSGGLINLGSNANVKITGGAIGYILETDGTGNLSWTPKGTLYTKIQGLSNATPIVMTVANTTPYINKQSVTITGAIAANANTIVNGQTFYVKLDNDYPTSGNVTLYSDSGLTTPVAGTNLGTYTANSGVATAVIITGGGSANAGGAAGSIQFNNSGILDGSANLTFTGGTLLNLTGNANITGNINVTANIAGSVLKSNVGTGTAPITVTSTTRVANLNVAYANVADFLTLTTVSSGIYYPVLSNGLTGNVQESANTNLSFNAGTGTLSATLFTGTLTTAVQPNITSVGTLSSLSVSGNANVGNVNTTGVFATTLSSTGNANVGNLGTAGLITATGNVTGGNIVTAGLANVGSLSVSGTSNLGPIGNLTITGGSANFLLQTNGSGVLSWVAPPSTATIANGTSNVNIPVADGNVNTSVGGVANIFVVTSTGANLTGTLSVSGNANVGNVGATLFVGNLSGTGNSNVGNLGVTGLVTVTGNVNAGNLSVTGKSNLNSVSNVYISGGSANQILSTDGAGNLSWTDPTGGYYLHTQVSANTTWTVVHNLNRQYVSVEPIDANGNSYVGRYDFPSISYTNANALTMTFTSAVSGWAAVVGGGLNIGNISGNYSPAGVNTQVQFNDAGNMAGSSGLVYNKTTGTLTATLYAGSGANLTNLPGANVSGQVSFAAVANSVAGGNVSGQVANALVAGTVYTNAQPNITSVGTLASLSITGTVTAGNVYANSGTVGASLLTGTLTTAAQPNVTSVSNAFTNLTFANAQTITGNNLTLSAGANTNSGFITGNWTLTAGSTLQATYADLAEYYEADQHYEAGTVLEFGGEKEVTIASDATTRVAGVVSTEPAYAMNTKCPGIAIPIALQGRVPVKVRGLIRKGDMMISGGNGFARPTNSPSMGTVIGKALQNFDGVEGIIEIAVGRL